MERNEKVVRIPITHKERKLNEMGEGYVPCDISERWLKFPDTVSDFRWLTVDVMTLGNDGSPKKICELALNKEDLLRAINAVKCESK